MALKPLLQRMLSQLHELNGTDTHRQSRYNTIQNINQRNVASDVTAKLPTIKKEAPVKGTPPASGTNLPGLSTSKIDVNAKPIYKPAGKPITQVNIDEGMSAGL